MCPSRHTSQGYILVVDDCEDQRELLRHTLERGGHRVAVAASGEDAIARLREERPSLVISDVSMPGMSGFELCQAVKKQARDVPVLLVTALWDVKYLLNGLTAGADSYLIKPLNRQMLIDRTESILQGRPVEGERSDPEALFTYRFEGEEHTIPHSRRQILEILIASHESTIRDKTKSLANRRQDASRGPEAA